MAARTDDLGSVLDELNRTVEFFNQGRRKLNDLYGNVESYCEELNQVRAEEDYEVKFVSDDDKETLRKLLDVNPCIIITGQMNVGKTSLINELLGGTYLPSKKITNTARKVIVKYAENNHYEVIDPKGKVIDSGPLVISNDTSGHVSLPEHVVELEGSARKGAKLRDTVEVGLNLPLLRTGLTIIDTPGLNENELLEELVLKGLDEMLQLVVYVIDGKNRPNITDVAILHGFKARRIHVMYVCNKIEFDHLNERYNSFSGCEDESDSESRDKSLRQKTLEKEKREKEQRRAKEQQNKVATLERLQKDGILPDSDDMDLTDYHAMSLKRVRSARRKGADEYTYTFLDFVRSINKRFDRCLEKRLLTLNSKLICAHGLLWDYSLLIAENHGNRDQLIDVVGLVMAFHEDRMQFVRLTSVEMEKDLRSKIEDIDPSLYIEDLDLSLMQTNPDDGFDSCKLRVCYMMWQVLASILSAILEEVLAKIRISEPVRVELNDMSFLTFDFNSLVYYHAGESQREWDGFDGQWEKAVFDYFTEHFVGAMESVEPVSGPINQDWCLMTAIAFLDAVSVSSIVTIIKNAIKIKLSSMQDKFLAGIRSFMDTSSVIDRLGQDQRRQLDSIRLRLGLDSHMAEALQKGSTSDLVHLEGEITRTDDEFQEYAVMSLPGFVARKFDRENLLKEVCRRRFTCQRMVNPPKLFLLDPTVTFDANWDLVFLIPETRGVVSSCLPLIKREFSLRKRLVCLLQICEMVVDLMQQGETIPVLEFDDFVLTTNSERLELIYDWLRVPRGNCRESVSVSLAKLFLLLVIGRNPMRLGARSEVCDWSVLRDSLVDEGVFNLAMKAVICGYLHGDESVENFTSAVEGLLSWSTDELD